MPHYNTWLIENRVVYARVFGNFAEHEMAEVDADIIPLFESSDAPLVHVLADDLDLESMPGMKKMAQLDYIKHEKMGWFVTSNPNRTLRFIGTVVGQLLKTRHRFVDTPEDGIAFLTSIDSNLPPEAEMIARLQEVRAEAHRHLEAVDTGTL